MALTKVSTGMLEAGAASVDLNLDDGTLYIDVANGRVGVGTTTPSTSFEVSGDTTLASGTVTGALSTNTLSVSSTATVDTLTVSTTATVPYDNTISGLTATNVQSAITELNTLLGGGNVGSQATWNIYEFTTTANQTQFDISSQGSPAPSYVPGYVQVYLNGILLGENDYTAVDGSTINFSPGIANAGQLLSVVVLDSFNTAELLRVTSIDASASTNSIAIDANDDVSLFGSLSFADGEKAIFGADSDLQIYHDGSKSAVVDTGTGDLYLSGNNLRLTNATIDATYLQAINGGAVDIRHNNLVKLATSSTGIDITGTVTANAAEIGTGGASDANAFIDLTGDTTYTDFGFRIIRNSGANGNTELRHRGTGNLIIEAVEAGEIVFETSDIPRMRIDSSGKVGIGTTDPVEDLVILGPDAGSVFLQIGNTTTTVADNNGLYVGLDGNSNGYIGTRHNADLVFETNDVEAVRIDSSGNLILKGNDLEFDNGTVLHRITHSGTDLLIRADYGNALASSTMQFSVDGVERMRIDSSGNILTAGNGAAIFLEKQGTATDALTQFSSDELKFAASGWDTNGNSAKVGAWMIRNDPVASIYPDFDLNFYDDFQNEAQLKVSFHARGTANHADPKSATFYGNVEINQGDQAYTNAGPGNLLINNGDLKLESTSELQFNSGSNDFSNYIRPNNYPSQGFTSSTNKFWIEYGAKGGHHFVLNTDGGATAPENAYDHFTVWQGTIDGDRLFYVTNAGNVVASGDATFAGNVTADDVSITDNGSLSFGDKTTVEYDIVIGNQTTARAMVFAPYSTIGTRYSNWDTWIGQNTRPPIGTQNSGVELASSFIAGGASGLNAEFQQLAFYTWTPSELTGLAESDPLTLGTPKFLVDVSGNTTITGDLVVADGKGINFNAMTGGAAYSAGTGTSSTLDDYEEGTWTPSFRNNTVQMGYGTPSFIGGNYIKIGNLVTIYFGVLFNGTLTGTGTGELRIYGIPFAGNVLQVGGYREPNQSMIIGNQTTASDSYQFYGFINNAGFIGTRLLDGFDTVYRTNRLSNTTFIKGTLQYFVS